MTGRRLSLPDDGGSVSVMMAILGLAIFVTLALVVHGGRSLGALSEAQDIADNAARAGAQAVDLEQWRSTGRPVIDRDQAEVEIAQFLGDSELDERIDTWIIVDSSGPEPDLTVAVQITITPRPFFFPERTVTAVGSATALDGVSAP